MNIKSKLTLFFVVTSIVPIILLAVFILYNAKKIIYSELSKSELHFIEGKVSHFEDVIKNMGQGIVNMSQSVSVQEILTFQKTGLDSIDQSSFLQWEKQLGILLKEYRKNHPELIQLFFIQDFGKKNLQIDFEKTKLITSSLHYRALRKKHDFFQKLKKSKDREVHTSKVISSTEINFEDTNYRPIVLMGTSIVSDQTKKSLGFILGVIDIQLLFRSLTPKVPNRVYIITDEKGNFLHHPDPKKHFAFLKKPESSISPVTAPNYFVEQPELVKNTKGRIFKFHHDIQENEIRNWRKVFYNPHDKENYWIFFSNMDEKGVLAPINRIFEVVKIVISIFFIATGVLIYFIIMKIGRPIKKLTDDALKIAEGDREVNIHIPETGDELEKLSSAINKMTTNLIEAEARMSAILDTASDPIITIDQRGIIQSFNVAAEKVFGYSSDEAIGRNVNILMPEPYHGEHDSYLSTYLKSGISKIIGIGREVEAKKRNGEIFPIDLAISEVNIQGKRLFSGIIRDISERKEAEERLNLAFQDLKASNEELEKFAYVASHDLKSPLRAIDNLSLWLEEDLSENLDDENRNRLSKLRGRVLRMESFLDDLLEYSRAGNTLEDSEIIRASRLIEEIKNLVNVPKNVVISIESGLKDIKIPRMPLEQIFQNLINNAIKHHNKTNAQIMISGQTLEHFYEFKVEDNGPGIPAKYHHKVFEMFQTLKPRDEVEGSGMGLALVKKILNRFSGDIYLDSEQGKGTTFTFRWPKELKLKKQYSLK